MNSASSEHGTNNVASCPGPALSVVIVTWKRPTYVDRCLRHLIPDVTPDDEIIIVDASDDTATQTVVAQFPSVLYTRFPGGAGHMTSSRNEALLHVSNEVIAFLDDDVEVRPGWCQALREAFRDPTLAAAAGRTCNGEPGEELVGIDAVGTIRDDGTLTANFAADTGRPVTIQHGIGANMIFRSATLSRLGGFRDDFPGTEMREDTDVFLRVGALGGRILFLPQAAADHLGAPHAKGRRFDWRYRYWANHNHVVLLGRNFGLRSRVVQLWLLSSVRQAVQEATNMQGGRIRSLWRISVPVVGSAAGLLTCLGRAGLRPVDPCRQDPNASQICRHLDP